MGLSWFGAVSHSHRRPLILRCKEVSRVRVSCHDLSAFPATQVRSRVQWLLTKAAEPGSAFAESLPEYKALERVAAQNCVVISILAKQSDTGEKVGCSACSVASTPC